MKEFAVIVSLHVKPGTETEFLRLLMPVIDGVRTEKTFINNFLHQDPDDPTRFMVYENWADKDEFLHRPDEARLSQAPMKHGFPSCSPSRGASRYGTLCARISPATGSKRRPTACPSAVSADHVWQAIRSFRDYEWGEGVGPGVIEGGRPDNEIGSVRAFTYYGSAVTPATDCAFRPGTQLQLGIVRALRGHRALRTDFAGRIDR